MNEEERRAFLTHGFCDLLTSNYVRVRCEQEWQAKQHSIVRDTSCTTGSHTTATACSRAAPFSCEWGA